MARPMLTDEVQAAFGESLMKISYLTLALAAALSTACTTESALAPQTSAAVASPAAFTQAQVPMLFVVDGVRLQKDEVPALTSEQVANVRVIKGRMALKQYGPDASYGVVVITTKSAPAPRI